MRFQEALLITLIQKLEREVRNFWIKVESLTMNQLSLLMKTTHEMRSTQILRGLASPYYHLHFLVITQLSHLKFPGNSVSMVCKCCHSMRNGTRLPKEARAWPKPSLSKDTLTRNLWTDSAGKEHSILRFAQKISSGRTH